MIRLTLSEAKQLIRSLLAEVRVMGDTSALSNDVYYAYELYVRSKFDYGYDSSGKFILTTHPTSYEAEKQLKTMGLNQKPNSGEPYYIIGAATSIKVDHTRKALDLDVTERTKYMTRRPGPRGKGSRTYVIPHADVAYERLSNFKKMVVGLLAIDKRITNDYRIVGNPTYHGMTIADIKGKQRVTDQAVRGGSVEPMVFYHGTSEKRLEKIKTQGLRPGNAPFSYEDLVDGYSNHNVYLAVNVGDAENYATRAAVDDKSKAVVLKVLVRDPALLFPDEDSLHWLKVMHPDGVETEVHFKHRQWREWPNADKIHSQFMQSFARSANRRGTVAYRGRILPRDVTVHSIYKPASMSKDPDWTEFSDARQKTFDTYVKDPLPKKSTTKRQK